MARKQGVINLADIFTEFNEMRNIDKDVFTRVLQDSFRSVIVKTYGSDDNYDVIVNLDRGDLEVYRNREVVADGEVSDSNLQIGLSEARVIDSEAEIGEDVAEIVDFSKFGRRMILNLRQTLVAKVGELQKESVFKKYKDLEGQIVVGELYQVWKKELLLLDEGGNELILPKGQQIPTDRYRKGDIVKAVVMSVEDRNSVTRITLSRTSPLFLQRLFEQEVPEIHDGLIAIKGIARVPGERAKVAVESFNERIDPVGACVGIKGSRIHGIVRELRNENIDIVNYTTNTELYIRRTLAPAKISSITLNKEERHAIVNLKSEEVSLAIGRGGLNIKLASMLTGYQIDVYRELEEDGVEDIYLDEFNDEISQEYIDRLKISGFNTAREVLAMDKIRLLEKTQLDSDVVEDIIKILSAEFESDSGDDQ